MKTILNKLFELGEVIGRAKAASALTRSRKYKEAQELMAGKKWVKAHAPKKSCCTTC